MGILRVDPMRGFENVARKMNDFFGDLEKGFSVEYGAFIPRTDISEDAKNLFVHVELPGIKKDEVKVSINDENVLIIKGDKKREQAQDEAKSETTFIRVERGFGEFTRSFMLPDNVDKASINAKFENGLLEIILNKKEPEKPKVFEVEIL
ncbi:MAG: Hsp20/alpha crystallin family protein [Candidatus Kapabacteria bacterium]|nr:Hsp20/alpha crystallin family protein [Candidatus Kapabacteria bacterium]